LPNRKRGTILLRYRPRREGKPTMLREPMIPLLSDNIHA